MIFFSLSRSWWLPSFPLGCWIYLELCNKASPSSLSLLPIKATNHWGSDKSCQRRAELWLYCTVHIEESPACLPSVRIEKISLSLSPYPPFSPLTAVHQVVINQRNGDGRTNVCLRWIWERGKKGWKWEKWEQPAVLVFLSPFSVCVHYMWGFHTRSTTIKYKGGKRSIRHMNPDLLPGWLTFGARDIWLLLLLLPAPFFLISQWQAMPRYIHGGKGKQLKYWRQVWRIPDARDRGRWHGIFVFYAYFFHRNVLLLTNFEALFHCKKIVLMIHTWPGHHWEIRPGRKGQFCPRAGGPRAELAFSEGLIFQ